MGAYEGARAYRANSVLTASPGQLVLMLYDGALRSLALAREAFALPPEDMTRIAAINRQLIKAQAILNELQSTLNHDAGGDFSRHLESLYEYYNRRLIEANVRKQVEPVIEVERLLTEVRNAWAEMLGKRDTSAPMPVQGVA